MARTKQTARRSSKEFITWTRFYLPREQEWPTWSVDHDDVHVGPLRDVGGWRKVSLGRSVEDPEQAAYIIQWATLDALERFQSSPACADFLRNLPRDKPRASIDSGAALSHLTLDDASYASPPVQSRFLVLKHASKIRTPEAEGRVTMTSFLVPHKVDDATACSMYRDSFNSVFGGFVPRGAEFLTAHDWWSKSLAVWFRALAEDHWVEEQFGQLEQTGEDSNQGRTIFCHFFIWSPRLGATPEREEASAADPQARESWNRAIARVMPPATAWVQERWDIRDLPRFWDPEPEFDPEEDPEFVLEQRKLLREYLELHGFGSGESSQ